MSAISDVVIRVRVDQGKALKDLATLEARLRGLEKAGDRFDRVGDRMERRLKGLFNQVRELDGEVRDLDAGLSKTERSFNNLNRTTKATDGELRKTNKTATRAATIFDGMGHAVSAVAKSFRPFVKMLKFTTIGFIGLTSVLGAARFALWAGDIAARAFRASLSGIGIVAGAATAALSTFLGAMRELQVIRASAGLGGVASAMKGLSATLGSGQLGVFGNQALSQIAEQAAAAGVQLNSSYRGILATLGNFALAKPGDPGKNLAELASVFQTMQKTGKVTLETFNELAKVSPVLAEAFGEFVGGKGGNRMKRGERFAEKGKTSAEAFIAAVQSGQLETVKAYDGLLAAANDTLVARTKNAMANIREQLTQLGIPLAQSLKGPLHALESTVSVFIGRISPSILKVFGGQMAPKAGGAADFIGDKLAAWVNTGLPKLDGMWTKILAFIGKIRNWVESIHPKLEKLGAAWDKIFEGILRPLGLEVWNSFKTAIEGFTGAISGNEDRMERWRSTMRDIFEIINKIIEGFAIMAQSVSPLVSALKAMAAVLSPILSGFNKLNSGSGGMLGTLLSLGLVGGGIYGRMGKMAKKGGHGRGLTNLLGFLGFGASRFGGRRTDQNGQPYYGPAFGPGGGRFNAAKTFGKTAAPIMAMVMGEVLSSKIDAANETGQGIAGALSGAGAGAATGAMLGSFAGPWGTAIGAGLGGLGGGVMGYFNGRSNAREAREAREAAERERRAAVWLEMTSVTDPFDPSSYRAAKNRNYREMTQARLDRGDIGPYLGRLSTDSGSLYDINKKAIQQEFRTPAGGLSRTGREEMAKLEARLSKSYDEARKRFNLKGSDSEVKDQLQSMFDSKNDRYNDFASNLQEAETKLQHAGRLVSFNLKGMSDTFGISAERIRSWAATTGHALDQNLIGLDAFKQMIGYVGDKAADAATGVGNLVSALQAPLFDIQNKVGVRQAVDNSFADMLGLGGTTDMNLIEQTISQFYMDRANWMQSLFQDGTYDSIEEAYQGFRKGSNYARAQLVASGASEEVLAEFDSQRLSQGRVFREGMNDPFVAAQYDPTQAAALDAILRPYAEGVAYDEDRGRFNFEQGEAGQATRPWTAEMEENYQKANKAIKDAFGEGASISKEDFKRTIVGTWSEQSESAAGRINASFEAGGDSVALKIKEAFSGVKITVYNSPLNTAPNARTTDTDKDGIFDEFDKAPTNPNAHDTASSRFNRTMSSHYAIDSAVAGRRSIMSGMRSGNLGSLGSDHLTGRAYDITGDNLGGYASAIRANGGFAEMHGGQGDKHLHVVPGDTPAPRTYNGPSGEGGSGGNQYTIIVQGTADAEETANRVIQKLGRLQRSMAERR